MLDLDRLPSFGNGGDQLVARLQQLVANLEAAHPGVTFVIPAIANTFVGAASYSLFGGTLPGTPLVIGDTNVSYYSTDLTIGCEGPGCTIGCEGPGCINPFLCYKAKSTKGHICSADAEANVGAACEEEEEEEDDCGGITDDTADCVPNQVAKGLQVTLADQFETKDYDVKKPVSLCTPADVNGAGVLDAVTHLKGYQVKEVKKSCVAGAPANAGQVCTAEEDCAGTTKVTAYCKPTPKHTAQTELLVENAFGSIRLDTIKAERLLVPTAKSLTAPVEAPDPAGHGVDHFKCYKVKVTPKTPKFAVITGVAVADQFTGATPKVFDLQKPTRLCTPVDKNGEGVKNPTPHLLCYRAVGAKGQPKHVAVKGIFVNNQFGPEQLDTVKEEELCVPSTKQVGTGG